MKKETVTEEKVINTPAGGVLIGKDKEGQTIIPNDGSLGGFLTGRLHKDGGIKAVVKSTGQPIEMQANEIVITAPAVADTTKRNFQGKMMTNREILSKINVDGGGLAFADGGEMPSSFKPKGKKYTYGGKLMSDSDILKEINDCGCEHREDDKKKMKYGGNLSKGMTLGDIANRRNVSLKHINEQLLIGIEKEKEHGGTKAERIAIAKDHLVENPNYYTLVEKAGLESGGTFDSKPFLDYYHSEIAEFLKDQNGIKLDDDYTFRYKGEKFTVQPMVLVDKESDESIKKANFVITDSEDEEVGEINFDSGKKKKFAAYSQFFEWNPIRDSYFEDGGKLSRKQDLVKDAKNGNSPSRDLNNYNDLVDVQEDGVVGNHVDFPEQGASGAAVAFADGGDISFLDDVDRIFDQGGSTGGSEKPNVDLVKIVKTHATTAGIDKYQELVGKMFIDWTSLKTELRKVFKEQGKFIGAFTIEINDNQKAKIFIKFEDKKNTVANFNPLTGVFSDFKKQAVRNQPTTFNSFDWNDFQSSNNKEQQPNTPSSTKPVLEYVEVSNYVTYPELKNKRIGSLFEFYNILLDNTKESLELFQTYFGFGSDSFFVAIFFKAEGVIDKDTFITSGTTFQDFKVFFLQLPVFKEGNVVGTVSSILNTDKFIAGGAGAKAGEAKSSDKEVVRKLMVYELLGSKDGESEIVGYQRYSIDTFYPALKDFAEKHKDCYAVRVEINADNSESHGFSIIINKTDGITHFDFETKNLDDFKKYILTRVNYENYKELKEDFDFTSFFGEESEQPSGSKEGKELLNFVNFINSDSKDEKINDLFDLYVKLKKIYTSNETTPVVLTINGKTNYDFKFYVKKEGTDSNPYVFIFKKNTYSDFQKFFESLDLIDSDTGAVVKLIDVYNLKSFFGEGIVDSVVYNYNNSKGRFVSGTAESLKILYEKIKSGDYEFDNNVSYFSIYPSVYSIKRSFKREAIRVIKDIKKSDNDFDLKKGTILDLEKTIRYLYTNYKELNWESFFGEDSEQPSGETKQSSEATSPFKDILELVEVTNNMTFPKLKDEKIKSLSQLYEFLLENSQPFVQYFRTVFRLENNKNFIKDIWFGTEAVDEDTFITTGTTFEDFKKFFLQLPINNNGENGLLDDLLNVNKFIGEQSNKPTEKAKEESKPQEVSDFELERKYLFSRINALSKELDFKRPSLTNEEVGFYSREINKLILKLRKVTEKQESLKPLSERLKAIYSVKWGEYSKEYPETTLLSVNGSKSQLTESEYQTVRNFEFKSFFGDWEKAYLENNPASASQIINPETREPLAVFHGTDTLFTDWKTYATNNAHYFSKKRNFAEWFASSWEARSDKAGVDSRALKQLNPNRGRFVYRCFLDIRKPVDFSRFGVEKRPVKEFLMFLKINYGIGDYDFWTGLGNASAVTAETQVYAWQIIRLWQNFTMYIKAYTTYDGYIFYEYNPDTQSGGLDNASLCFCAFESSQVKFADAYEFSALSNDSRFNFGGEI